MAGRKPRINPEDSLLVIGDFTQHYPHHFCLCIGSRDVWDIHVIKKTYVSKQYYHLNRKYCHSKDIIIDRLTHAQLLYFRTNEINKISLPVQKLCVNIYLFIRMHSLYEFCYRTYIYIHKECRSVMMKPLPITVYRAVLGNARFLCWMPLFVFFGLPIVSWSMINSLILGCLWPLVFVLNNILTLGIWRSAISHLPGCFCSWTFIQNIGFNMAPSDPFMLHLATQLGYSVGSLRLCNWLPLRC